MNNDPGQSPTIKQAPRGTKWDNLKNVSFVGNKIDDSEADIKELYQTIENPLTNDAIKTIMSKYAETGRDVYYCLSQINVENTDHVKNPKDEKDFRETLYKDWVNSLRGLTKEQVQKSGNAFFAMGRYVFSHPDIKTRQELVDSIESDQLYNREQKDKLEDLVYKECFDHSSKTGWDYARNTFIHPKHRLYMNVPKDDLYRFASLIKEGCDNAGVKYDFKYEDAGKRADSLVMYLDDEKLRPTIDVLKTIGAEHPEIIDRMGKPPILSGKIESWLGYGSESKDGRNSFNEIRAKVIQKTFENHIQEYAKQHGHDMTNATYRGQKLTVNQYIAVQETNEYMKELAKDYKTVKRRNEFGHDSSEEKINAELGYDAKQLKVGSPLYNTLLYYFAMRMETNDEDALEQLKEKGSIALEKNLIGSIRLSLGDKNSRIVKQRLSLPEKTKSKVLRKVIIGGILRDTTEIESIKKDILDSSEKIGVDSKNFCFDSYLLDNK